MTRYRGTVQGSAKSEASRVGNVKSGIRTLVASYNVGVKAVGYTEGNQEVFDIHVTQGSGDVFGRLVASVFFDPETGRTMFVSRIHPTWGPREVFPDRE